LIIEIGRIVTEETFRIAKLLEPYNVRISMNLSPIQLMQAGFVKEFVETFKERELKEGSIAIEITENFLMTNLENIIDK
jgi:EAL domain-containing protein (putative c-di-GMP-specific phosphodiesterase class I)